MPNIRYNVPDYKGKDSCTYPPVWRLPLSSNPSVRTEIGIGGSLYTHRIIQEVELIEIHRKNFLFGIIAFQLHGYTYFGCEPKDLKIEEAATLVGMCKNPSLYNPVRYNERSRGRRNVVLDQMRKAGYITVEERDSLQALPLKLSYHRVDHNEGLATYFREYLRGVLNAKKPDKSDYRGWQMQKYSRIRSTGKQTLCSAGAKRIQRRTEANIIFIRTG